MQMKRGLDRTKGGWHLMLWNPQHHVQFTFRPIQTPIPLICILFHFLVRMIHSRSTAIHVLELASLHLKLELMTDMFHVLGLFIFKRQFCQTVIICSTSE